MYTINILIIIVLVILSLCMPWGDIVRYLKININPLTAGRREEYKKLPRVNSSTRVIVCFTTTQERIGRCIYTIDSILCQTVRVDEIRIHIPQGYVIPEGLKMLERYIPEFKIVICEKDWGPSTKLIPILMDPTIPINSRIIYIDDDIIYNKNLIKIMVKYSTIYPRYAICNKGWNVDEYPEKKHKLFFDYMRGCLLPGDTSFTLVDVVQGFSGVLVRPFFFDVGALISYKDYPPEAFYVDDVYISGMLNNRNIRRISTGIPLGIPYIKEFLNEILKTPTSLASIHNKDKRNDRVIANYFKWKKQIFFNLK